MPLYIRDRIVLPSYIPPYFKVELLSGIFSAIFYGIVVVLSGNCFHLLLKKRDIYPNRTRILLLVYVIFMLLNSTWKQVGSICILMANLNPKYMTNPFFYCAFGLPITMTMWGADGFMVRILFFHQGHRLTIKLQIWRCLVLYRQVSRGPRVVIIVLLSFLSFASFGKPISISSPPFKSLIKILSLRCHGISRYIRVRACICRASVYFSLRSRKYHTRSVDHVSTCLPSKTCPRCPWSATWISLHQCYHHVRRIFGTNGHCWWPVYHSVFRASVAGWSKNHVRHHRSYLRRWLKTR